MASAPVGFSLAPIEPSALVPANLGSLTFPYRPNALGFSVRASLVAVPVEPLRVLSLIPFGVSSRAASTLLPGGATRSPSFAIPRAVCAATRDKYAPLHAICQGIRCGSG
jgi:hypothetical protein